MTPPGGYSLRQLHASVNTNSENNIHDEQTLNNKVVADSHLSHDFLGADVHHSVQGAAVASVNCTHSYFSVFSPCGPGSNENECHK